MTAGFTFPTGFVWGTATAAFQIEGATSRDGRGPSIWDTFCNEPGRVHNGDTGSRACEHYDRWPEDLDLMDSLGIPSYRFSIAWPRIVPDGVGKPNQAGLDFYSQLVDGLLERNIEPLVTLYHWDLPQALQDVGGWLQRDTTAHFADYAALIGETLGDRVRNFTTMNEPWCSAFLGYSSGVHAPGVKDNAAALRVAHHLNLAHGAAVTALRSVTGPDTSCSITLNLAQIYPASDSPADVHAARHADAVANRIFLEPIFHGSYPQDLLTETAHISDWSFVAAGDLAAISVPIDVLGVNYYTPSRVAAANDELRNQIRTGGNFDPNQVEAGPTLWPGTDLAFTIPQAGPYTDMGWPIVPAGFTDLVLRVHRDYPGTPIVITENGAAFADTISPEAKVADPDRIAYVSSHLAALHAAIESGADVRGYYLWSFMDNFEWAWGYSKRFGIVHVDYDSQVRTPKDSARWYGDVIRANGL
jgi:beta-glucosidase